MYPCLTPMVKTAPVLAGPYGLAQALKVVAKPFRCQEARRDEAELVSRMVVQGNSNNTDETLDEEQEEKTA